MAKNYEIHLSTRGSAFTDNEASEVARILRELADNIEGFHLGLAHGEITRLKDINGNRVGYATAVESS